jgi:hypothetical protein
VKNMTKLVLGGVLAVLVALLAGFLWGASGKSDQTSAIGTAQLRSDLLEARGNVLAARVDLYNVNFGEASRHLEDARGFLARAAQRLQRAGGSDKAKELDAAVAQVDQAQQLARRLDQAANTRAGDAAKTIEGVLQSVPTQ